MNVDYSLILHAIPATIKANNSAVRLCRVVWVCSWEETIRQRGSCTAFVLPSHPPNRVRFRVPQHGVRLLRRTSLGILVFFF